MRRSRPALILYLLALLIGGGAYGEEIASADLQIQGVGLEVVTISVVTGLDIPAVIQTEFGGKQNDEAQVVEGLLAVGDLSGPGIDSPIRLETAPGRKFQIPGLSREGVYFLQNIRLMKGSDFLQSATPSVATITVSNLLQTSVRVKQLTPEDLRARGISIDARNYDVFEYTFSFLINGQIVEIPFPVIVDPRTHEVREIPKETPYDLPPINPILPPRWQPPDIAGFNLTGAGDSPGPPSEDPGAKASGGRISIPAAIIIPNSLAVLHQFVAVTLMVTNGAAAGSSVTLDSVTAQMKPPAGLRTVKSIPSVTFNQPVPIVDATTGVTFLVAQAKGEAEWTMEGLQPGTHTLEVDVRATYKSAGQPDFPLKGSVRASVVVHDPRFNVTFSHPDTVREGIEYSTFSFITNMSGVTQNIRVTNGVQGCAESPGANVCRVEGTPESHDLSIPAGEMRSIEYKLRPGITGHVFATAGSVSDDAIQASVQLHMGVSESGIPLSPATLVLPYYSRFVSQPMVSANLQLLGLGYSLATAPLTPALASHPHVIKSDVFQRATDIARAGQRVFLGEPMRDSLAHMTLDLLGNSLELSEWDELRRAEKSGRTGSASVAREIETSLEFATLDDFVSRFAAITAWRPPYMLAVTSGGSLSVRGVASNARLAVASEAAAGWVRQLPFAELNTFRGGELAMVGRFAGDYEITITPTADGPFTLDVILPATADASVLRGHFDVTGTAGTALKLLVTRGASGLDLRDSVGGIAAVGTITPVSPESIRILGARQDLHLDAGGHKVSVLWNRPVSFADDLLQKFSAQVLLDRDGVHYTGPRPMSSAALQDGARVANVTFDHALSKNATYSMTVAPLVDPLNNTAVSFPDPVVPVIDNDSPGGILFGHVLKGDHSAIANAEVRLFLEGGGGPPQYDLSRSTDGAFLFEYVPRDIDNKLPGTYKLEAVTVEGKSTSVDGAVRLPGRVHFVNLVFLGRGSAQGFVRYDNNEIVPGAKVVVGSTMFDQFRTTIADASGHYTVDDLPVGPLTFSATDADGNVTFAASEIKTPGQQLQRDLSIFRRPFPGTATIRGVVRRSDTNAVVPGARAGVYSQGYGLIDGFTDSAGRFEFTRVPVGFVTVLAAEWSISRESTALDFDLAANEVRDLTLTLNVRPTEALAVVEGDVVREDPLHPGDATFYQNVAGALVKIESSQAVTADANGHFTMSSVPVSFATKRIQAYDPITTRTAGTTLPQLDPSKINLVPIFISTANGYGEGTIRVRLLNAAGSPVGGYRVIEPGFPPLGPTTLEALPNGVYQLKNVKVGAITTVWATGGGSNYGDQTATGSVKIEFNGHVAALTLRLPGQGIVRTKLAADIDIIGDVSILYPAWDEADQALSAKSITKSTVENGQAGYATFTGVPALQNFTVSSAHPVYGYAAQSTKLGFDGDVQSITLQLNKLSSVRGVIYAIDGRTPIPGAAVRIEDGRQNPGIFTSRPDGTYEFFNVAAGVGFRVIADIAQDGVYRTGIVSGSTPSVGGPVNGVSLIMRTQGGIDGRIVYAGYRVFDPQNPANNVVDNTPNDLSDNAPVPLAQFVLRELDFPYRSFGSTADPSTADVAGRFTINNVFTGPLRATAYDPGNQEIRGTWTGTLSLEGERVTAIIGIGAEGFGPVTVRVLDPNAQNAPVLNAEVTLIKGLQRFDLSTTDVTGTVRFEQVPVGSYRVTAYSKALGKSGGSSPFNVATIIGATVDVVLEFSGKVEGKLSDPEELGAGVPGVPVTLTEQSFQTRASTDTGGLFEFLGVREGLFRLDAKDTQSNRRATATRQLTQADPSPYVSLELEPTETLYLSIYLPNDSGGNSNILAPLVNLEVRQRSEDFFRALQGNPFVMPALFRNESYSIAVKEIGGAAREIHASNTFPTGTSSNPLKLVLPAYGAVEVHVVQGIAPAANAKVSVWGGSRNVTVYADSAGVALASGIPLGPAYVQVVSVDGAFSGSANATLVSQSNPAIVAITLGAYAGISGLVDAEAGGPSVGTRVIASFAGRVLEGFTDSTGRYTFQGIPTSTSVSLTYMGPDDVTVGARQTVNVGIGDASRVIEAPRVKLDATPPLVMSIFPSDGANNVSPDSTMRIVFSEPIPSAYINTSYFQLIPADSTTPVGTGFSSTVNPDGTFTVIMTPPAAPPGQAFPLKSNTLYRIIVSGEIKDLTGNRLPASRGASFITSDYAEPKVQKVIPATTSALQPATTFEFRFNEPIDPAPWETGGSGQFHFYKISGPGPTGAILAEKPGRAFVDPASSLSLFFAPDDSIEAESFYRVVFSGVRDMQGNVLAQQTFHFFSYDLVKPFVNLVSPVPADYPLISGVEYTLGVDIRNADANGPPATDVVKVDYFRVDGSTPTYIFTATSLPWPYRFVAPDAPPAGSTLSLRAVATDLSGNESDPATITWQVKPNQAPQNVTVTMTPATAVYPGNHALASVTFEDEGTFATVQVEAVATQTDGSEYKSSQVKNLTRLKVNDPWAALSFDFDLPATLKQGTRITFNATVTDVRGLKGTGSAGLDLSIDTISPEILSTSPPPQTQYHIGDKFTILAVVKDFETGTSEVTFAFDNRTIKVTRPSSLVTSTGDHVWTFSSGQITVPAKNVDTAIPITITAKDYKDNFVTKTTEVVYIGVNDPSVPKGAWLCPIEKATYPAGLSMPVKLQVRATDDISVTAVKFTVPGVADPVIATRVGTTDVYEATTTIAFPAAGETLTLTATISDANPDHDLALPIALDTVAVDITIDNFTQAITPADAPTYANKSIYVRGTNGRLIPHVALTLKNLIVLDGARVDTLATTTTVEHKLELTITDHAFIDCASSIDVSSRGYLGGWGVNPDGSNTKNEDNRGRTVGNTAVGGPTPGASASHGGLGGQVSPGITNATYDSFDNPTSLGTGGAGGASCCQAGAPGGGAIKLQGGVFAVAGAIRADGGNGVGAANAGSGGSIDISSNQFVTGPSARITANGGDDDAVSNASRGGGGGRVAIDAGDRFEVETPGLQIQSRGGRNNTGSEAANILDGGAGTILLRRPGQILGDLFAGSYDERAPQSLHLTRPTPLTGTLRFDHLTLGSRALVRADASLEIGGVVDSKAAATIDPTAALILNGEVPVLTATTTPPSGSSLIQASSLTVTYSAISAAGIGAVTLAFSPLTPDRTDSYFFYPGTATPSPAVSLAVPFDAVVGPATLALTTTDRAGRGAALAPIAYSIVANGPPVIDQFDPVPQSLYPGKSVATTVSAHDDLKITRLTFTSTIGTGTPSPQTSFPNVATVTNQIFSVSIPIATPGGQNLTLDVAVEDAFPGRAATTQTKIVSILKDMIAPVVTIIAPANDQLFLEGTGNTIQVRATINDAEVGVKDAFVQIDGGTPVILTKSGAEYVATLPVPSVDGTETVNKSLTVTGKDYEGNASSPSVNIRVQPLNDPNAPSISWVCSTTGAMYPAGYAAKLRVFALGNTTGNPANGIQKVEMFVGDSTTPLTATLVSGVANNYEVIYTIPADAVAGSATSVRAVATNASGLTESASTSFTVVAGTKITADKTIAANETSFDGLSVIVQSGTTTIVGQHTFDKLIVLDGAKVTHLAADATTVQRLNVTATSNVFVSCLGSIDVSNRGITGSVSGVAYNYDRATDKPTLTGGATNFGGGSHGGPGGQWQPTSNVPPAFGSPYDPNTPGTAAAGSTTTTCAACRAGGGVARIRTATLHVDGKILANGESADAAGAGGSIRIDATTIRGAGEIHADGGQDTAGGASGGGGRIGIYYKTLSIPSSKISAASANGGGGDHNGAPGTIYLRQLDDAGAKVGDELIADNLARTTNLTTNVVNAGSGTVAAVSGNVVTLSAPVPFDIEGTWIDFLDGGGNLISSYEITARTSTTVTVRLAGGEATANAPVGSAYRGMVAGDRLTGRGLGILGCSGTIATTFSTSGSGLVRFNYVRAPQDMTLQSATVEVNGTLTAPNLTLNGTTLTHTRANATTINRLNVNVAGTLTVDATSAIDVSMRGLTGSVSGTAYTYDKVNGKPTLVGGATVWSSGSHGGQGGLWTGNVPAPFGSLFDPNEPGGAGAGNTGTNCMPCRSGGGVARVKAGAIQLDGKILANGEWSDSAGAGGAIRIDAATIGGAGEIHADGGQVTNGSSGGGGRIAIFYTTLSIPMAKITAVSLQAANTVNEGAAGTIYLKSINQAYGDLIVDNLTRATGRPTLLSGVGYATVTSFGSNFVQDANAQFLAPDQLRGVRAVVNSDRTKSWPIVSNDNKQLNLDVSADPLVAQAGQPIRGLYKFDTVKLRNAKLDVIDLLEVGAPIDKDAPSSVIGNNQLPPLLNPSLIHLEPTATGSAVRGSAGAVTDTDTPIVALATNTATGNVYTATVNADGSFAVAVQGNAGDAITFKARDGNFYPLESPVLAVGNLESGTPVPSQIDKTEWTSDTSFFPRTISRDGAHLAVASYPTTNGGNDFLVILSVVDPAHPSVFHKLKTDVGHIRDVVVSNGWAYVAADRLFTLDLANPNALPNKPVNDPCGADNAVVLSGGYAFTAEVNCNHDGRLNIWDVADPNKPRFIRQAPVAGYGGIYFTDLFALGSDYLVALSPLRPGNVGRDVMVIDRRDLSALSKVAEIEVPNIDAFRGTLVGTMLYLVSTTSTKFVAVDLSDPANPTVVGNATLPAAAAGVAVIGTDAFAATTTAGLAALDVTIPASPVLTGTNPVGGNAFDVSVIGAYVYVANEIGIALVPAQVAPSVALSRISMSLNGTMVTITGLPQSVTGNTAITLELTNTTNLSQISGLPLQGDGSFSATLPASPNDTITIKATDVAARATFLVVGHVPFGSQSQSIPISPDSTDGAFLARNVSTSGNDLVVASYPTDNGASQRLFLFDVTDRAHPVFKKKFSSGAGNVRDVVVLNGYALVAAERLVALDLSAENPMPVGVGDPCGADNALEVVGGYAFTAEINCNHDGRINIWDVSTPSQPRFLRQAAVAGYGGLYFTGLAALGSDYLVGISPLTPGNVGRDVMVIDRRDINNLFKVKEIDIPNFNAFRAKAVGMKLYVAGVEGGLAVVDLSDLANPVVNVLHTQGYPRSLDAIGAMLGVADGSAGATFVDISPAGLPVILGNQPTGGTAWECAFSGATLYIANEQGLSVIHTLGTAPLIDRNLITASSDGAVTATVTGSAKAILGLAPITLEVRNATSGATTPAIPIASDGSFSATIAGASGDALTVKASDAAGRASGPLSIGTVPFGSQTRYIPISTAMSNGTFLARNIAVEGNDLAVSSTPTDIGGSDKIVLFDVSIPGNPVHKRTVSSDAGNVRGVAIKDGWLFAAAEQLISLDLSKDDSTTNLANGNPCGADNAIELAGGYVFTAEVNCNHDGRLNIWDVTTPSKPRFLGQQAVAGYGGIYFTGLTAFGTDYLIGISPLRPGNVGRDVMVIDRRDVNNLRKVSEFDIPSFDGFTAKAVGNMLYVTGVAGGVAVVDLSNPAAPSLVTTFSSAGAAHGIDVSGAVAVVANGSNGVSFIDGTIPTSPHVIGAHPVPGSAWDVALSRGAIYVASELGLTAIANAAVPPMLNESLVTITPATSQTTVTGAAQALTGITPITVQLTNEITNATSAAGAVNGDGSFSATVTAIPGQGLTITTTDVVGRATIRSLGSTYGTTNSYVANPAAALDDLNYRARRIASDGNVTIVGTGSLYGTGTPTSNKLLLFRQPNATAPPVITFGGGGVQDVKISSGYAFVTGDRFGTIDLSDPELETNLANTDPCGFETSLVLSGQYAFTAEVNCNHDGRIHIYDIGNLGSPSAPRYVRSQGVAGFGGIVFRGLVALGTDYIIALSPDRPSNVDRDVMIIRRVNINNLEKKFELGIPNFDALDGVVDGSMLYVAGGEGGVAVVSLIDPERPALVKVINTPGIARGIAMAGVNEVVVADAGGPGLTFINLSDISNPVITSQKLEGNIVDVDVVGEWIYVAGENHFHTVVRP